MVFTLLPSIERITSFCFRPETDALPSHDVAAT